jgi:Glutaredoxin-like domain (DUF836)
LTLDFYYRENCHLCDAMRKAMVAFNRHSKVLEWQEIDIDRDVELIRQYDVLVPVLSYDGKEICHHFFDEAALVSLLKNIS